ncbi:GNAT family N-acetyltransferase [Halobacteriovorax sp. ZH4_bin.1]|uniref:GNAT family N-acetyltransferase n=1 Tax=unclassified Halobacteriovorax TaxID=2639665 RepID=UPI00371AEB4C
MSISIRKYREDDSLELLKLFNKTIHTVNINDYNSTQVNAWAPNDRDLNEWRDSFSSREVFIIEVDQVIAGFSDIELNGHIDRFYISSDHIGQGVGEKLYLEIEKCAKSYAIQKLFLEASITAKPFFLKMGFEIMNKQVVTLRGVDFINYRMCKYI